MAQTLSLSDAIGGYQKGLQEHVGQVTKQLGEAEKTYQSKMGAAEQEESGLDPNALTPPKLTPPPQPQNTSPVEQWGSAAMWVAALGGLLTRQPLTNSLHAAADVMNAYKAQDASAAQQAYDSWKVESANAVKMAQFTIDAYKTALTKIDSDKKAAATDFLTTAKALGDENAAYVATHYGIDAAVSYVDAVTAHNDRMKAAQPLVDAKHQQAMLQLGVLNAVKKLQAAKQSGDPAAISQATQDVHDANEQLLGYQGKAAAADAKASKDAPLFDAASKEIDKALETITKTPTVVGVPGEVRRVGEAVGGWTGATKKAPAQAFESQIRAVQASVRNLLTKSHYMSAGAVEQVDELVKGLGVWDTPESARESLSQLKDILAEQRGQQPPSEAGADAADALSNLSDDEILKQLGVQ